MKSLQDGRVLSSELQADLASLGIIIISRDLVAGCDSRSSAYMYMHRQVKNKQPGWCAAEGG